MIFQVVQTVEQIHGMYLTCSIARLIPMIFHCELMGQAIQDDTGTELSGPEKP